MKRQARDPNPRFYDPRLNIAFEEALKLAQRGEIVSACRMLSDAAKGAKREWEAEELILEAWRLWSRAH